MTYWPTRIFAYVNRIDSYFIPVTEVFKALEALPKVIEVQAMERVEHNYWYDDCDDVPEGIDRITSYFEFQVKTEQGKFVHFIRWGDRKYNPERPR